jgi:hypothetical protein
MPGFSFTTVGRLGLTSPPYRQYGGSYRHRYYDPLRLPDIHFRFLHSSLVTQYLECFLSFVYFVNITTHYQAENCLITPGRIDHPGCPFPPGFYFKETSGSPEFQDYPCEYMTWSQTPVESQLTRHIVNETAAFPCIK